MAGKNPFFDNTDDDFSFGAKTNTKDFDGASKRPYGNAESDYPPPSYGEPMSQYELLQQKKQQSMNRQLEATQRCMASIYESESIGVATAEELVRQGEQLDNTERNVDKIIADTKVSQRHLNSIKSIFGGIKNWWSGEGKKDDLPPPSSSNRDRSSLQQTLAKERDSGVHPALRIRSGDTRGFYDDDIADFNSYDPFASGNVSNNPRREATSSARTNATSSRDVPSQQQCQTNNSSRSNEWKEYEQGLEKNLDMMSGGLSNLKVLAQGLGDEIEAQNDQLERITEKVDRSDTKIRNQNLQMKHILGK